MSKILDGVLVAQKINNNTQKRVAELKRKNIAPHLAVILVGEDPASCLYVSIKEKKCRELGIEFSKYVLPDNSAEKEITYLIKSLNNDDNINAIIIQLPLPKQFNTDKIISTILPTKDADALTDKAAVNAPTATGIIELLKEYSINLKNRKIVIVGYGKLVGEPLARILQRDYDNLDITICNSKTKNLAKLTQNADIVISAVGKPNLITKNMVKKNAVVIDAGTSVKKMRNAKCEMRNAKIVGDVDFENVKNITSYITPSKGGVGPVTVAKLLENVVKLYQSK